MHYKQKLKEYREKNNLTQKQIAEKLKITQQQYSLYESNKREMTIDLYIQVSRIFNVKIDDLIEIIEI